jgi:CheY-like chemotaxis protein
MLGDSARLQQVVWNLLSNGVKFTPEGGRILVQLEPAEERARLTVRDTGRGISADFLPFVFDRFRQAESEVTRSHGGLGLGLAIVRELVHMHGGSVSAHSGGEEQGATFIIELPLSRAMRSTPSEAAPGDSAIAANSLSGLRVLVVEDEPATREALMSILQAAGADVVGAQTVSEALIALGERATDVLVSDIGLPVEDGCSLIRRVHQDAAKRGERPLPALAVSAYARLEDQERALASGFQSFVAKPVKMADFIRSVAKLSGRAH